MLSTIYELILKPFALSLSKGEGFKNMCDFHPSMLRQAQYERIEIPRRLGQF
jgi:hypothetical protein